MFFNLDGSHITIQYLYLLLVVSQQPKLDRLMSACKKGCDVRGSAGSHQQEVCYSILVWGLLDHIMWPYTSKSVGDLGVLANNGMDVFH